MPSRQSEKSLTRREYALLRGAKRKGFYILLLLFRVRSYEEYPQKRVDGKRWSEPSNRLIRRISLFEQIIN
jgi:hypothetical protein